MMLLMLFQYRILYPNTRRRGCNDVLGLCRLGVPICPEARALPAVHLLCFDVAMALIAVAPFTRSGQLALL
jgi:hypothetical protein